jgi:hypothetical protein
MSVWSSGRHHHHDAEEDGGESGLDKMGEENLRGPELE